MAVVESIKKLNPFKLYKNPVIFITEIGAVLITLEALFPKHYASSFILHITLWLWFTVLFANFSEALAEMRNHAQAKALEKTRVAITANLVLDNSIKKVGVKELKKDDVVIVKTGEIVPLDGKIVAGTAAIDESSLTGESEPVIKAVGTDNDSVTGGTKVVSDEIKVQITSQAGESYLDKMISLIKGAERQRTRNEIALTILLAGLTILFLITIVSLKIFGKYFKFNFSIAMLTAFLICLIPTTIAGLLSAIGIAGINRLMRKNVLAMSGEAVEAAGDIDVIMIDKTGTITFGNRKAHDFIMEEGIEKKELVEAAYLSSLEDTTVEGQSIRELALGLFPELKAKDPSFYKFIPFTATTRMSGVDGKEGSYRKGAIDVIRSFAKKSISSALLEAIKAASSKGETALLVATLEKPLGIVLLKDMIKPGLSEKFSRFRPMGIKTVMITGDHKLTAEAIAREVGVDDFLAEASPEKKMAYLLEVRQKGFMVAMTGDGINDAPALAHADVGVAMNAGSQAAKEAGNMIDLDSQPTKLFDIIAIGKQMLITRGALTTFSTANDVSKYFVVIPAMLTPMFPFFKTLNIMRLSTPESAILSAVIFNALIIVMLIPLAFRGVKFVAKEVNRILRKNLLIYGIGGILLPFLGIKLIDMLITALL